MDVSQECGREGFLTHVFFFFCIVMPGNAVFHHVYSAGDSRLINHQSELVGLVTKSLIVVCDIFKII